MKYSFYSFFLLTIIACSHSTPEPKQQEVVQLEQKTVDIDTATDAIYLIINDNAMAKLEAKRTNALQKGVLESSNNDYVKAMFVYKGDTLKSKIRLKGDWLDHIRGEKWSFRVKMKNDAWKDMKTFSLQSPSTRSFLDEWFAHKLFEKADVLTTRYGFVKLNLNGKDLGVYAYEEHFDKQIVEHRKRREGPIVKFTEEEMWLGQRLKSEIGRVPNIPNSEVCEILPFKKSRTSSSTTLLANFENAKNLMLAYKHWKYPASEIFDVDKLARYLALLNITKGYHGLTWHNERFYYNPITAKLEPIAFDCFQDHGVYDWVKRTILGDIKPSKSSHSPISDQFFLDEQVYNIYFSYLKKYSAPGFIDSVYNEVAESAQEWTKKIKAEFPDMNFSKEFFTSNADTIRNALQTKKYVFDRVHAEKEMQKKFEYAKPAFDTVYSTNVPEYYVRAYTNKLTFDAATIKITNYYSLDIETLGIGTKDSLTIPFGKNIAVNSYNKGMNTAQVSIPQYAPFLYFRATGKEQIFKVPVFKWSEPGIYIARRDLEARYSIEKSKYKHYIQGNAVVFAKGNHTIDIPLFIPKDYSVRFEAGAHILLKKSAFFVSYSNIVAKGTDNHPITISSPDGTGKSFTVICAKGKSVLEYTHFDQLSSFSYNGWSLSGAVNFYESDVTFRNCIFSNNRCEDALNTIRSCFTATNCAFDNIYADAFDSDFCTGTVARCSFTDIGNDAIDFSTSVIDIKQCTINHTGDKGISGGERSTLDVSNVTINNAVIGIASKDASKVTVQGATITNCKYGFVALQKKPEYGSAYLTANGIKMLRVKEPHFIELKSEFVLNAEPIEGYVKNAAKEFYP